MLLLTNIQYNLLMYQIPISLVVSPTVLPALLGS